MVDGGVEDLLPRWRKACRYVKKAKAPSAAPHLQVSQGSIQQRRLVGDGGPVQSSPLTTRHTKSAGNPLVPQTDKYMHQSLSPRKTSCIARLCGTAP